jgi:hypothetical protein
LTNYLLANTLNSESWQNALLPGKRNFNNSSSDAVDQGHSELDGCTFRSDASSQNKDKTITGSNNLFQLVIPDYVIFRFSSNPKRKCVMNTENQAHERSNLVAGNSPIEMHPCNLQINVLL